MAEVKGTVAAGPGRKGRDLRMRGGKPKNSKATIRRLAGYLSHHWYLLLIALFCLILSSISGVLGSYMLKPIMDQIAESASAIASATGDVTGLIDEGVVKLFRMLVLMAGVIGVTILTTYLQMRIMLSVAQRALIDIRKDLFDHLQDMPVRS